jgi:choline/ethanolamine kinase
VKDAKEKCANFLGQAWTGLSDDEFTISTIQGGMVNQLYLCENKSKNELPDGVPRKVLMRYYGGKLLDKDSEFRNGGEAEEVLVFYTMSQLGQGPKLYGVFEGGRLEGYLEKSHRISNDDVGNPELTAAFARKLAFFHSLDLPFNRNQKTILEKIDSMLVKYIEQFRQELFDIPVEPEKQAIKDQFLKLDIEIEQTWMKSIFDKIKFRKSFTHGDMNRANCLIRDDVDEINDKIVLIDYEFAAYGYRDYDIGGHFTARRMDVANVANNFDSGLPYPNEEERLHFIRAYIDETKILSPYEVDENGYENEENMLMGAEYFAMSNYLFFISMFIKDRHKWKDNPVMPMPESSIFDFSVHMVDRFFERKEEFLARFADRL